MTLVLSVEDVHDAQHSNEAGAHGGEHHGGGVAQRLRGSSNRAGLEEDHAGDEVAVVQEVARGLTTTAHNNWCLLRR